MSRHIADVEQPVERHVHSGDGCGWGRRRKVLPPSAPDSLVLQLWSGICAIHAHSVVPRHIGGWKRALVDQNSRIDLAELRLRIR